MGSWRQHAWAWPPWRMSTACRRPRIRRTRSRVPSTAGGTISMPGQRQASTSKWEPIIFCFRSGSAQLSSAWRRTLSERRNSMRVPAILLMGIVLSACVSSKRAAIPARSASQSRIDTGSTSRAPGPCPGGPSARIHPAHHLQRWQVHSAGRLNGAGRSQWRVHDLHRSLYSTRRSRRNHSPERGALHFGQCAGLLLPLRPPSSAVVSFKPDVRPTARHPHDPLNCHPPPRAFVKSVELECSRSRTMDNCLARVRSGIPCPASAASGRSCLPVLSGRSSSFSGVPI